MKDKDSQEENNDTEDELLDSRKKAKTRTPRKRKLKISEKTEKVPKRTKTSSKSPTKTQSEKSIDYLDIKLDMDPINQDSEPEAQESSGEIEGIEADVDSCGEAEDVDSGGENGITNGLTVKLDEVQENEVKMEVETEENNKQEKIIDLPQEDADAETQASGEVKNEKEWDCNTSIESIKLTPDQSGESESGMYLNINL